jgi:hypothetical protein
MKDLSLGRRLVIVECVGRVVLVNIVPGFRMKQVKRGTQFRAGSQNDGVGDVCYC